MSEAKQDGGPAFPVAEDHKVAADLPWACGMTLRDYFAAKAMQGIYQMIAGRAHEVSRTNPEGDIARQAYLMADAMLKARQA